MPRNKPNQTIEHRISFSNFERERIDKLLKINEENVYIDGITSTLQAGSGLLAGGGMFWAAAVFGLWKAPEIGGWIKDKLGDTLSNLVDPGGVLDDMADSLLPGSPITLRRRAQALAVRRSALVSEEAAFCTFSASTYDASLCSVVFEKKHTYAADLIQFQADVRAHNIEHDVQASDFIYQGLGDIDPNLDSNPETTRDGVQSVNPASAVGTPVSYVNLGAKGFVQYTEVETVNAFNRAWSSYFYQLQPGSHYFNYRRDTTAGGASIAFDVEWNGAEWIYAVAGSYDQWKLQHETQMISDQNQRREDAEAAGDNYAERPGYYDEESGTWMFDN